MHEARTQLRSDGGDAGGVAWETHLVPQGNLPVVPPRGACGQQLLQVPQKQHFAGPVPLVAGFLEGHVRSGTPLPLLTLLLTCNAFLPHPNSAWRILPGLLF